MIEVLTLVSALVIIGLIGGYTLRVGVSPMPTRKKVGKLIDQLLPDDVAGTVYELGSGWGTLAIPLAKRYPACRVVGFELSPLPWLVSRLRQRFYDLPNLRLYRRDLFAADLGDAALVMCFLHPECMAKLKDKFEAELKPGTYVLSNFFAVPGWTPITGWTADDFHRSRVYLYRVSDKDEKI